MASYKEENLGKNKYSPPRPSMPFLENDTCTEGISILATNSTYILTNIYIYIYIYIYMDFKLHSFQKHNLAHKQTYFAYEEQIIGLKV
jgi:hypothetical protein